MCGTWLYGRFALVDPISFSLRLVLLQTIFFSRRFIFTGGGSKKIFVCYGGGVWGWWLFFNSTTALIGLFYSCFKKKTISFLVFLEN